LLVEANMSINQVLNEILSDALDTRQGFSFTRRDAVLPDVPNKAQAVIGMRRTGKTTFLRQLQGQWRSRVQPERVVFIGFDDDRLLDISTGQLDYLFEEYFRRYPELRKKETVWWLLDEIQMVTGWERFVRRILDSENIQVVVSGSSAKMLSREVHSSLRGRGMETIIRPFSFREFLRHKNEEPDSPVPSLTGQKRSRLENLLVEYLKTGGFPEVQGLSAELHREILRGYVDTVLFRDVVERHGVSQVAALRWVVRQCLKNPAGSFSVNKLNQDLRSQGLGVAKDAIYAMVSHLEDAFLIRSVTIATESERRKNSNPRKIYPVDTGLISTFNSSGSSNIGHALETVVLHELDRRKADLGYVRTSGGREVDFLARFPDSREELIQVCADLSDKETVTRELEALVEASAEYPRASLKILVLTASQANNDFGNNVTVQPIAEWLMDV
jgi:hypothetical protein